MKKKAKRDMCGICVSWRCSRFRKRTLLLLFSSRGLFVLPARLVFPGALGAGGAQLPAVVPKADTG